MRGMFLPVPVVARHAGSSSIRQTSGEFDDRPPQFGRQRPNLVTRHHCRTLYTFFLERTIVNHKGHKGTKALTYTSTLDIPCSILDISSALCLPIPCSPDHRPAVILVSCSPVFCLLPFLLSAPRYTPYFQTILAAQKTHMEHFFWISQEERGM